MARAIVVLDSLRSVRLFLGLTVAIAALSAAATLSPSLLPGFFTSPLFGVLVLLLEVNLIACTVPRLVSRVRGQLARRNARRILPRGARRTDTGLDTLLLFAPDVIHLGIALLIAVGMLGLPLKHQADLVARIGETRSFMGTPIRVTDAREVLDSRGMVTDWVLELEGPDGACEISANRPARIGSLRCYFRYFGRHPYVALAAEGGGRYRLGVGEGFVGADGRVYYLADVAADDTAVVVVEPSGAHERGPEEAPAGEARPTEAGGPGPRSDGARERGPSAERRPVRPGERIDTYTYLTAGMEIVTGFKVSRNPARVPIVVALVTVVLGMSMYLLRIWRRRG